MNDKMREEFEAAVLSEYPNQNMGKFASGEYQSTTIEHCWWAWQASRASIEVELPDYTNPFYGGDNFDECQYAADCEKAIEAAGLKVKP